MNAPALACLWCALRTLAPVQTPPAPTPPIPTSPAAAPQAPTLSAPQAPPAPSATEARLDIDPRERAYFALGTALARGAFAYASLADQAARIERSTAAGAKVAALGRLAPDALRARASAGAAFAQATDLMQQLSAPPAIVSPVSRLAARLARPLPLTADARAIQSLNPDAATALSALSESSSIAKAMDDHALTAWLAGSAGRRTGPAWYAEGQIAGIAQIAADAHLPALLPPAADVATDLRGLRDWLALRVPEQPGPALAALQAAIADFLQQTAQGPGRPRLPRARPVSDAQLQQLGTISAALQAQILPAADAPAQLPSQ